MNFKKAKVNYKNEEFYTMINITQRAIIIIPRDDDRDVIGFIRSRLNGARVLATPSDNPDLTTIALEINTNVTSSVLELHEYNKRSMKYFFLVTPRVTMVTNVSSKVAIRKEIATKLKALSVEEKQNQSKQVLQKLFDLPSFQNSKRISTYLSINNEIDTEPIVRKIFETGKECFVPRYNKAGMEMVKLNSIHEWETLPVTNWGIKQPSFGDQRQNALDTGGLDFIVVPGVAFTSSGLRLGHGGGYYDKYLKTIKDSQVKPPAIVALAFKEQILEDLPVTEHDIKIDKILYPE